MPQLPVTYTGANLRDTVNAIDTDVQTLIAAGSSFDPSLYYPKTAFKSDGTANAPVAFDANGGFSAKYLTVYKAGAETKLNFDVDSGQAGGIYLSLGGTLKWMLGSSSNIFWIYNYAAGDSALWVDSSNIVTFTKSPTGPTPAAGDNSTQLATTAFVQTTAKPWAELTPVATTSGTSVTLPGVPSSATEIEIYFSGVSTNGTAHVLMQMIVSGSPVTTGYESSSNVLGQAVSVTSTSGFVIYDNAATNVMSGRFHFKKWPATNDWILDGQATANAASSGTAVNSIGRISLAGTPSGILLTTVGGAAAFDAGAVFIRYR